MIRLENPNPSLGPSGFVFTSESGVKVTKFDPGFPEIRDVSDDIPQMHGANDRTAYFGSRAITIEFRIYAPWSSSQTNRRSILDTLQGLSNPALRPYLYESIDEQDERRIMVRPDSLSSPYVFPHTSEVQMQWIAPQSIWESGTIETLEIGPGSGGSLTTGRSYNLTFPRTYASRAPSGGQAAYNNGNIETYPAFVVTGPCTNATINNLTTGYSMVFTALNLLAGESVIIDNKARSITMGNQTNVSKYDKVDWTQSRWLTLVPGLNQLSFNPTGYTDTTKLKVAYRHNWI